MHSLVGGGAPGALPASRGPRDVPRGCLCAARQQLLPSSRLPARQRARVVRVSAAAKTLYEVLGVGPGATEREIKRAYRQKALKLHPDVNKAPNAEAQFLEVKSAFGVLSDAQERAQYDRKLQFGNWSASGGFGDFGGWGGSSSTASSSSSSSAAGGSRPRPKQQEEEFYGLGDFISDVGSGVGAWVTQQAAELSKLQQGASGALEGVVHKAGDALKAGKLEDFFNDLEKEVSSWSKARAESGKPASLWEELSAIGEEFVDFLEAGLGEQQQGSGKEGSSERGSASFNSSSNSQQQRRRSASPLDAYEQLKQRYDLYDEGSKSSGSKGGSSSSSNKSSSSSSSSKATAGGSSSNNSSSSSNGSRAAPPPPPPRPPKKTRDEEVEDELAALKRKLGKI